MALPTSTRIDSLDDERLYLETGDGETPTAVYFLEYLDWHTATYPQHLEAITEDGWLTDTALTALGTVVNAELADALPDEILVEVGIGGDDPHVALSISLPATDDVDEAWAAAQPFVDLCSGMTDPGTGMPYLFREVAPIVADN